MRASFGFPTSNFTIIEGSKFRLNPGLDNEKNLARYGVFFKTVQEAIDRAMKEVQAKENQMRKEVLDKMPKDLMVSMSKTVSNKMGQQLKEEARAFVRNELKMPPLKDGDLDPAVDKRVLELHGVDAGEFDARVAKRFEELVNTHTGKMIKKRLEAKYQALVDEHVAKAIKIL
jgi:predicted RNA-binding protein Jag